MAGGWVDADEEADGAGAGPSNAGHRQRLRQRALTAGLIALADYELLELFLFRSIPQKDVKPVAKALLDRFGSLEQVLTAGIDDIAAVKALCHNARTGKTERRGTGAEGALDLKLMHEAVQRISKAKIEKRPVIGSWNSLLDYVRSKFAAEKRESFHALFLDTKNGLIRDETLNRGTIDHAPAYPREIATRALELGAAAVILVHNHPSGDPTPSRADIDMTRQIVDACRPLKITVHDHLVVGNGGVASFKALGLF